MSARALGLGAIADDYTGASDLANTLTRAGLRTVQTIGIPRDDLRLPDVEAIVIALKSRSIPAAEAVDKSLGAEAWLRGRGAGHILFKICSTFDSTDAGNIGPVMDALQGSSGAPFVLVTPAFPGTGRTVYQGHLFVGQVLLSESPLRNHPLNPMQDANLVRVLQRQSKAAVGLLDLGVVSKGRDHLRAAVTLLTEKGQTAAIVDAVFDADLEAIGSVALEHPISVGASGMGYGLARAILEKTEQGKAAHPPARLAHVEGHVACLAGSCSEVTLRQIAEAEHVMPVHRLDPTALMAGASVVGDALRWAEARLARGPVLIASSASAQAVAALQARHGREATGAAIEKAMAAIAAGLVARGVRRLVVAGGETSGAVVDRLAVPAFLVGAEIAPGVPLLETIGLDEPMLMALKSGNFGGPTFFADALSQMRGRP